MVSGGWLMIPIGFMSLMVTVVVIERFISLCGVACAAQPCWSQELGSLAEVRARLIRGKRTAICQRYPSAAANVVKPCC